MTVIDEYLATVSSPQRETLEKLRSVILEVVPDAEQVISYNLPAFRVGEGIVAGFAATKSGCSYYPFSGSTLSTLSDDVSGYKQTKGSLQFAADKCLPKVLVRKLIKERLREIEVRRH